MATSLSTPTLISNYYRNKPHAYISSFPRNPNPKSLSPKFHLGVSSSDDNETRWLREEQRWLREESRWLREESRWFSERDSLLREISELQLEIDALENQKQILNDVESGSNVGLIAESASNINAMSLGTTKLKEEEKASAMLVKDITLAETDQNDSEELKREGEKLRAIQVGRSKNSNVVTIKCSACRGEGRLLCMECDGTGLPNIEEQFMEWVEEGAKCPYCEGLGYTVCDACEG